MSIGTPTVFVYIKRRGRRSYLEVSFTTDQGDSEVFDGTGFVRIVESDEGVCQLRISHTQGVVSLLVTRLHDVIKGQPLRRIADSFVDRRWV